MYVELQKKHNYSNTEMEFCLSTPTRSARIAESVGAPYHFAGYVADANQPDRMKSRGERRDR